MGKNPAFQFYPRDWLSDTELQQASAVTRGIWINLLSHMWFATDRGMVSGTLDEMRRLSGCSEPEWFVFYEQNCRLKFADVTFCDGIVTVKNRRMVREEKERESTRLRVLRFRKRECNADVTSPSPSPSPSPVQKHVQKPLSNPDGFDAFWAHYFPRRKVAKQGALKAWKILNPTKELQAEILAALSKQSDRYSLVEDAKIPHAATWLNGRRWEDEIPSNGTGKAKAPDPYAGQSTAWKCVQCGGVHESKPGGPRTCPLVSTTLPL
jgi:hypothetical protein